MAIEEVADGGAGKESPIGMAPGEQAKSFFAPAGAGAASMSACTTSSGVWVGQTCGRERSARREAGRERDEKEPKIAL